MTDIFISHGHGDHWFAANLLAERFGARIVATTGTIGVMHFNVSARPILWDKVYPGIPPLPVTAVTVPNNRFTLEGHDLVIVEVGHTETDETSVLHVPDLDLIVAGDAIYNGVHQYLGESLTVGGLDPWRRAVDQIASLSPRSIISCHMNPDLDNDAARTIAQTREYFDVAEGYFSTEETAVDFFNAMVEHYPSWLGRTVLRSTATAWYGAREHEGEDPTPYIVAGWL